MESIAFNQLLILVSLCFVVAIVLLSLFKLRGIFGLGLFYVTLGLFKYLHFFLTRAFSIQITPEINVSLGSVLFTGILFSILLIYIYKDALEARKVIYALIAVNVVFVIMQASIAYGINTQGLTNNYNIPASFFNTNLRVSLIGTTLIFIDSFIIIYIYEIICKRIKFLLLRIFLTMAVVFFLHSFVFAIGGFAGTKGLYPVLISGLITKSITVPIFSLLFCGYFIFFDKRVDTIVNQNISFKDVFYVLANSKQYTQVFKEKFALKQELKDTEFYLQTIFDSTTDAIFIHDGETGVILDVNKQMCEMYGYKKSEVLNRKIHEFSLGESPYSSVESKQWLQKAKNEGVQTFEWKSKHKNGTIFWTEVSLKDIDISGKNMCIATVRNIEDRKKAKEKTLRETRLNKTILETTMDGYILADDAGQIKGVNPAYCTIIGYSEAELLTKNISQLEIKIPKEKLNYRIQEMIEKGQVQFETQHKHKNGNTIDLEVCIAVLKNENPPLLAAFVRDTTQKKQEKIEILKLNNQLVKAGEVSSLGFIDWNFITNEIELSEKTKLLYQMPNDEKDPIAFMNAAIHPDDLKKSQEGLELASKGLKKYDVDIRIIRKDKSMIWLNAKAELIKDKTGKTERLLGTVLDITQRKIAEQKLFNKEQQMASIYNTVGDIIFYLKVEAKDKYRFISVNNAFVKAISVTKKDVEGKFVNDVIPEPSLSLVLKKYKEAIEQKNMVSWEETTTYPAGDKIGTVTIAPVFNDEGICTNLIGSVHDTTEISLQAKSLKHLNNELKQLHKVSLHLSSTITLQDLTKKALADLQISVKPDIALFYLLNDKILNLVNYRLNAVEIDLTHEKSHPLGGCLCGLAASTKKAIFSNDIYEDLRCTIDSCKNAGVKSFAAVPLIAENKVLGVIGLGFVKQQDFTLNKNFIETFIFEIALGLQNVLLMESLKNHESELEEKIKQRTAQLEHSNSELRDFAQIVSHDLKAPLRAISQLSFWISQDYADKIDEEGQSHLKLLISRVQRLDNLIEGILQYSRAGRVREKEVEINFNEIVNETVQLLNPPSTIKIVIENKLPNYIGDQTRFTQLFQNLIHNAIKSINKPKGLIKIGCIKKDAFWEFYIADNGIGIEEKYFERIFNIFQRLESRDEQEGTGVGLSLVKRIVQIYGGDIWVNSKLEKGTTFFFKLPVIQNNNI
jgi:PAS domain S-box-containing protein